MTAFIRPASEADVAEIIEVFHASRQAALPWLPALHTPDEDAWFFGGQVRDQSAWVAQDEGAIVGFAISSPGWLDHLYLRPERRGQGVGSEMLSRVKRANPDGLSLWVFTRNAPARTFYAHRGFVEVEHTDGQGNEEKEPDIRMHWSGGSLADL